MKNLVTRAQWGARKPTSVSRIGGTMGVKVHYVGEHVGLDLETDHAHCGAMVRSIQRGHMDGRGWADIAYSALVCPHGSVFVGRGPLVLCAANGEGLNSGHYAVCGLVGDSGLTKPTTAMLSGIRDAIEWLRAEGHAGSEIKGHRDGYSTTCPGPDLYAWVKAGAPRPKTAPTTEDIVKELPTLHLGQTGEHVETLQGLLIARSHPEAKVNGVFDDVTFTAVKEVQEWGGLKPDGVVGPKTWPVLLRVA